MPLIVTVPLDKLANTPAEDVTGPYPAVEITGNTTPVNPLEADQTFPYVWTNPLDAERIVGVPEIWTNPEEAERTVTVPVIETVPLLRLAKTPAEEVTGPYPAVEMTGNTTPVRPLEAVHTLP